jgi:hypothetical protein
LWSNGKKNDPAFLAAPLFPLHDDLAGARRQFALEQRRVRFRDPLPGLLALRTTRRSFLRRPHLVIGSHVLFQKEGGKLLAQQTSPVLALGQCHQLILVGLREHPLKGLASALQPTLAQGLSILPAQKRTTFHGISPKRVYKRDQL